MEVQVESDNCAVVGADQQLAQSGARHNDSRDRLVAAPSARVGHGPPCHVISDAEARNDDITEAKVRDIGRSGRRASTSEPAGRGAGHDNSRCVNERYSRRRASVVERRASQCDLRLVEGAKVRHATHGLGEVVALHWTDKRGNPVYVRFENGDVHHFWLESAMKLQVTSGDAERAGERFSRRRSSAGAGSLHAQLFGESHELASGAEWRVGENHPDNVQKGSITDGLVAVAWRCFRALLMYPWALDFMFGVGMTTAFVASSCSILLG